MFQLTKIQLVEYVENVRIVQKECDNLSEMMDYMQLEEYANCKIEFRLTPLGYGVVVAIGGLIVSRFF